MHHPSNIVVNPEILGGKPIIDGTRISVEFVLNLLASGMNSEDIQEDYPHISKQDIQACLEYAAKSFRNEVYVNLDKAV